MSDHIYKRGAVWWLRAVVGGREHRRSLRTGDRSLARSRATEIVDKLQREQWGDRRYSWKEAVVEWAATVAPGLAPMTARRYRISMRTCRARLEPLMLDQIDRKVLASIAWREGVSNATRRRDLTAISSVLQAAVARGWLPDNPARAFDRSLLKERRDPMLLPTEAEIAALCSILPGNLVPLVRLLEQTGMRLEEAGGLRWDQVDLDRRVAQLTKTKGGRPRAVPLSADAVRTLSGTARRLNCPWVFWHETKDGPARYKGLTGRLRHYRRLAGLAWRTHALRHLYAVRFLQSGGSIYELQKILGHSSLVVTEIYLDFLTPEEQLVAKGLKVAG